MDLSSRHHCHHLRGKPVDFLTPDSKVISIPSQATHLQFRLLVLKARTYLVTLRGNLEATLRGFLRRFPTFLLERGFRSSRTL